MSYSIAAALFEASQVLRQAQIPEARRTAGSLLTHVVACDQTFLITHAEDEVEASQLATFRGYVGRRAQGEPLQYITGHQEFYGLDFEVNPAVLIPRPETELLVETALELSGDATSPPLICDVGTGSGCVVVALLHERPTALAVALDTSPAALAVARRNSERHAISERITFLVSDCFAALDRAECRFDLIVSNPPYIPTGDFAGLQREVREHEPRGALAAGADGLSVVRRLLTEAPDFLISGGHLIIEIGFGQRAAIEELIDASTWKLLSIRDDLQGIPRTVVLQKTAMSDKL